MQSCRNVLILAMEQPGVALDNGHPAAEAAHGLGQLEPNIATTQDEEMFRNAGQIQCFDMGQGVCFGKTRNWTDGRAGSRVDDDSLPVKQAYEAIGRGNLDGFGTNKASGAHDQLGSTFFVYIEMHLDQPGDHLALAL